MRRLLDEEWGRVEHEAGGLASGPALSITATAAAAQARLHGRPGSVCLHVEGAALAGDVRCETDVLPWAAASFDLIVVRHATDLLADRGLECELARLLAPGGTLLLFGLNPLSPWRLWWSRRAGACEPRLRCLAPTRMRERLAGFGLDVTRPCWLGGAWPSAPASHVMQADDGARWHGVWMLRADKRAAAVRPLPLRHALGATGRVAPALAPRVSLRECA
ncbi:MAG TPA: hypothetical protein PKO41_01455 [Dokdonella sp.]|uniref:hypothetical protein n=1 Tax=Dokdonella sp. TaxID=2291710 RepID=UPI0025BF2E2A|nr:hypothetical protein [Dokdonella sp.]MBX3692765.1 hypothetical protein [Dokdonella sp.]MCW5568821.1 hypothetical protein [Dokdonella sp.]HNR91067.1 hypothetical protein [Dokdonella sp.]